MQILPYRLSIAGHAQPPPTQQEEQEKAEDRSNFESLMALFSAADVSDHVSPPAPDEYLSSPSEPISFAHKKLPMLDKDAQSAGAPVVVEMVEMDETTPQEHDAKEPEPVHSKDDEPLTFVKADTNDEMLYGGKVSREEL